MEKEYKVALIRYRIEQAEETILDVQLLIEHDRLRSAVNRIYYGMFYSLLALAVSNDFQTSKHFRLIGWFNKRYIHSGLLEIKYGKIINRAFNRRTKGDYDAYVKFEKETVLEMYNEMEDFVSVIKNYLEIK